MEFSIVVSPREPTDKFYVDERLFVNETTTWDSLIRAANDGLNLKMSERYIRLLAKRQQDDTMPFMVDEMLYELDEEFDSEDEEYEFYFECSLSDVFRLAKHYQDGQQFVTDFKQHNRDIQELLRNI